LRSENVVEPPRSLLGKVRGPPPFLSFRFSCFPFFLHSLSPAHFGESLFPPLTGDFDILPLHPPVFFGLFSAPPPFPFSWSVSRRNFCNPQWTLRLANAFHPPGRPPTPRPPNPQHTSLHPNGVVALLPNPSFFENPLSSPPFCLGFSTICLESTFDFHLGFLVPSDSHLVFALFRSAFCKSSFWRLFRSEWPPPPAQAHTVSSFPSPSPFYLGPFPPSVCPSLFCGVVGQVFPYSFRDRLPILTCPFVHYVAFFIFLLHKFPFCY